MKFEGPMYRGGSFQTTIFLSRRDQKIGFYTQHTTYNTHHTTYNLRKPNRPLSGPRMEFPQHLASVKGPNRPDIDAEILDEMVNRALHLSVEFAEIVVVARISPVTQKFLDGLVQVHHPVDRAQGVGILDVLVAEGDDAADVVQLGISPFHHTLEGGIVGVVFCFRVRCFPCLLIDHGPISV